MEPPGAHSPNDFGVAQALAHDGAKVSMCSRTQSDVKAAADQLAKETGAETLALACDVTQPAQIDAWVAATVEKWGRVDGLLVNAGGPPAAYGGSRVVRHHTSGSPRTLRIPHSTEAPRYYSRIWASWVGQSL